MRKPRIIREDEDFPIKPSDIDAGEMLSEAFEHLQTEVAAGYIIRLLQKKGDWLKFTYGELNAFYKDSCKDLGRFVGQYTFFELLGKNRFVVREGNERNDGYDLRDTDIFQVTDQFVFHAYSSRPILRTKAVAQPAG